MTKLIDAIHELNPDSKDYQVIALQDLQLELATSKGAQFISLITVTYPDLNRNVLQPCPFDFDILKVSYINCCINFDYTSAVNKQREREGKPTDFVPQPRKWGTRLKDLPFIAHVKKDTGEAKLYLEVKLEKSINHIYYCILQNKIYSDEIVNPFLKEKKSNKEIQDVEKEIILRDYDVKNIICIVFDKQGYIIKENL